MAVCATLQALITHEAEEASAVDPEFAEIRKTINSGNFENCKQYQHVASELCIIG